MVGTICASKALYHFLKHFGVKHVRLRFAMEALTFVQLHEIRHTRHLKDVGITSGIPFPDQLLKGLVKTLGNHGFGEMRVHARLQ